MILGIDKVIRIMGMKRVLLWILRGIIFIAFIFAGLIAIDYFFQPLWLTDETAFFIFGAAIIVHVGIGIIKRKSKAKKDNNRDYRINKTERHIPKRHKSTLKPVFIGILAVVFVLGLGIGTYKICNHDSLEGIPENVIEFGEKYPEAQEYVWNFNKYVDKDFDMDVSEEMAEADIPLFIQWDKRWGYKSYGGNYIGVAGCGPTCLSMIACGLKNDSELNPFVVAKYASDQGFYSYGQGTSWFLMTEGAKQYGLSVVSGSVTSDYILENLSSQEPMICSMTPGDFTKTGHFIVLTGIDSDGKIIVNDPNSPQNSKKRWDVDTLVSQMKGIWKYSNSL